MKKMRLKISAFLIFFVILWLSSESEAQTTRCDYSYQYYWTTGCKPTNVSYYKCNLDTRQANYNEKLTRIDGQHETVHTNGDVKWLANYKDNKLKTFSPIFCKKFPNLKVIQITDSELESIDEDSVTNCRNLQHLSLYRNKIREVPEYLLIRNSKMIQFWIYNNQLTTLPENFFLKQNELEWMELSANQINFLPRNIFHPLVKLEVLYLNGNKLQSINPEWFVNLQNLKLLSLGRNQISEVPSKVFSSLRNLEKLWLHENKIKTLNSDIFEGLQNLQILNLKTNKISDLPPRVFGHIKNLQELRLRNNKLTTIHSDSFGVHNQLTKVYLGDNKINAIDEKFIDKTAVKTLNMTSNICSQLVTENRNEIKSNFKKCFDNYQPRPTHFNQNSCGKGILAQGMIIGGSEVTRGSYPWVAALVESNDKYFCGGTLVTNRKIITAAHCMIFLARDITVLLGVHDLSKRHEVGRFPYAVDKIHVHPDWNPRTDTYDADIAVMVLETDVTFSKYIKPICFIEPSSAVAGIAQAAAVGYGKDEDPNKLNVNVAKVIDVPIHQNEDCFLKNHILATLSSKRTFCGGTGNGTGVCKGDSGSGVVVTDGSAYYLRGIVSASLHNQTYGCDVDTYSIFTNVLHFTEWINGISVDSGILGKK